MKKCFLTIAAILCITFFAGISLAFAQQGVPVFHNPSQTAPIGGMAVLAVVGGGYALKKLYDKRKA